MELCNNALGIVDKKGGSLTEQRNASQHTSFEKIVRIFLSDTITLLDLLLSEDIEQPEHSANSVWSRLEMVAAYYSEQKAAPLTVPMLLQEYGYPLEAIETLYCMCKREKERHTALCEEQDCSSAFYEKPTPGWQ